MLGPTCAATVCSTLQIMLFIEFDGGSRQLYSCTDPASADACALTSPDHPESAAGCSPVDKWVAAGWK